MTAWTARAYTLEAGEGLIFAVARMGHEERCRSSIFGELVEVTRVAMMMVSGV